MRFLLIALFPLCLLTCNAPRAGQPIGSDDNGVTQPPTGLQGPAYDPGNSPVPITEATPLPVPNRPTTRPAPAGASARQTPAPNDPNPTPTPTPQAAKGPATYGTTAAAPSAYQQQQQDVAVMNPYGEMVSPSTYAAPAPGTAEAALAEVLSGRWVNGADEREIVEFTPDHYTTYYNGELLFQEAMTYYANCPGDCNGGVPMELSCFTMTGPAGTDCYGIIRLTSSVLELSLMGVSTETITYHKL